MQLAERKDAFIHTVLQDRLDRGTITMTTLKAWFKVVDKIEQKYNKDAASFTYDEAIDLFKSWESRSLSSLQNVASIMRKYTDYITGVEPELRGSENIYFKITKDVLRSECLKKNAAENNLLTREDITRIQNSMLNMVDKAILECLFIGIAGKQLTDLTGLNKDQLEVNTGVVTLESGKEIQLTPEQCNMLIAAFQEDESISYLDGQVSPVDGVGYLCKKKANAKKPDTPERKFRWVQRRFAIWQTHFELPVLTMKSVAMSGLVHELKMALSATGMSLNRFLKTSDGEQLAQKYGYTNREYVTILMDKVGVYFKE